MSGGGITGAATAYFLRKRGSDVTLLERRGEYIAAGFTGHGMPMTFFAGQNVSDMIAGKEPEPFVAEAFLPGRFAI